MADEQKPKRKLLSSLASVTRNAAQLLLGEVEEPTLQTSVSTFDADYVGVEMLLGNTDRPARSRVDIYMKWHHMVQEGLMNTILRLHVQMALGGHETTGETVFIEAKPGATPAEKKMVDDLQELAKFFNKNAHQVCFNAAGYGDAFAMLYTRKREGLYALNADIFPPMVQPYEVLGQTVTYVVTLGTKVTSRVSHMDMVRMKMPRMGYLPQMRAVENAQRINLEARDPSQMVPLPALIGGSFLEAAESDFDNLEAALRGLVGQRIAGSIDETMIGANMSDMTVDQQESFMRSLENMLKTMKKRAEDAVKTGRYSTSRHFHVMPTFNEKQLTQISSFQGTSNSGAGTNIEDVMFHARKLAGTAGIDLSMVGFADQLTGGLGEGGFNRTSSQAAERSRIIRTAFTEFCNDVIDRHMIAKHGRTWSDADRPYAINFYGSIAALEAEKQASRERAINSSLMLVQMIAGLRDLGMPSEANEQIFIKSELDGDFAKILADGLKNAKPPVQPGMESFGAPGDDKDVEPPVPERALTQQNDDEAA
jgi:hypothetical protein